MNRPPLRNPTTPAADEPRCDRAAHHARIRGQFRALSRIWLACLALVLATHTLALPAIASALLNVLGGAALLAGTVLAAWWSLDFDRSNR